MKKILSILDKIADGSGYLSGSLIPLMVVLIAYEVFMRYALNDPPMVADEFSAYMLVALSYLGLAYTWRKGGHVRVTIIFNHLPPKLAHWLRLFSLIISLGFIIAMTMSAWGMVTYSKMIGMRSDTWLTIELFWPQLPVLVGFILLTLILVSEILKGIAKLVSKDVNEEEVS